MSTSDAPRRLEQNQLLLALPRADYKELQKDLQDVTLPQGRVLFESRKRITHVYFPQQCVISLVAPIDGEKGVEVAIVGNEGMAGLSVFLGVDTASIQAVIQIPARAGARDGNAASHAPLQRRHAEPARAVFGV